ncbi:MAG TPA: hypothetical protein HA221_04380 [Halobacteria archaeon]|nr:hypothetical protein [Halobacteria archaeon]
MDEDNDFSEIIRYTVPGYIISLILGTFLDFFEFKLHTAGQIIIRLFAGEGESIFEGFFAIKKRLSNSKITMAEAYGWGKMIGMSFPIVLDLISRLIGIDVYGAEGFYIPYFYAMSDQIGANISGLIFIHHDEKNWAKTMKKYVKHPVMLASLIIIFAVPIGLFMARILGFSPTTHILTALETIFANICWLPPLVGWISEHNSKNNRSDKPR